MTAPEHVIEKQQYQMETGVWVIAECERCGRGFISIGPQASDRDPYGPQRGSSLYGASSTVCGGRIVWLTPNPANPETASALNCSVDVRGGQR